jgi:hypothetical protein
MWCLFDMMFDAYALRMFMIKPLIGFNIWDVTADIVAPCHILPQRGQKTMTIAMTERAPKDGITCKLS